VTRRASVEEEILGGVARHEIAYGRGDYERRVMVPEPITMTCVEPWELDRVFGRSGQRAA
jgi:hypothetical protein